MAKSSIFANIKITEPEKAEIFISELDASANEADMKSSGPDIPIERDPEKIRRLMAKRFPCE